MQNDLSIAQAGNLTRPADFLRAKLARVAALCLSMLAMVSSPVVHGQTDYPNKPIKFVVPYPPGGVSDNSSRAIAERLGRELGTTMIIDNKAGAASTIASNTVARSAPDGYTLYAAPVSFVINPVLQAKVEYDPIKDFSPVSMMITSAFVLQASNDLKVSDLKELLALIRANPDKYAIGTSGMGSINHLASEYFIKTFGLKMNVIHYKGGMPAAQDLLGGRIHVMFSATNEALPFVTSGRTKGLAVTSAKRISSLPDLPTVDEAAGVKDFVAEFWLALVVPAQTPKAIVSRLQSGMQVVGTDQTLRDDLARKGVDLKVSSPQEVQLYMKSDGDKWGQIIRELGIKE